MTIRIKAYENGPIVIDGQLDLENGGTSAPAESTALCRCGQSGKGLYCDGTHTKVAFVAAGVDLRASSTTDDA